MRNFKQQLLLGTKWGINISWNNLIDYSGNQIGKYFLTEKLGNGNFGSVYLAEDLVLKTLKALKIMELDEPDKALQLFKEAELPYKCNHNNIVKINDAVLEYYDTESLFIIDMEYVEGSNVDVLIKSGKLSVLDSLSIIKEALFGLQHLHDQGILHRDIKPGNIIVANGVPKLTDFGLSTTFSQKLDSDSCLWYTKHMAPECVKGTQPTPQMDVYAVGMTLYRMVNDIKNFSNYIIITKNGRALLQKGTFVQKAKFKPYVPNKVVRIVKKASNPDPSKRYQSASEMRDAIERLSPNINWYKINENSWEGKTKSALYSIEISNRRNGYVVDCKQNNRRISSNCKFFTNQEEAYEYMYRYIADTTLS